VQHHLAEAGHAQWVDKGVQRRRAGQLMLHRAASARLGAATQKQRY
jgi:hypothetical protein